MAMMRMNSEPTPNRDGFDPISSENLVQRFILQQKLPRPEVSRLRFLWQICAFPPQSPNNSSWFDWSATSGSSLPSLYRSKYFHRLWQQQEQPLQNRSKRLQTFHPLQWTRMSQSFCHHLPFFRRPC